MPATPQSEVLAKFFEEIGEKCGEILAKFFADFRPSISRENGRKKFHEKSSTFSTVHQIKFFSLLRLWGPRGPTLGKNCRKTILAPKLNCSPARPLQEPPGPSGPGIPKESPRVSRGLPARWSKKCPNHSRNSLRSLKTVSFETLETVSRLFWTLFGPRGRKAPGDSLETLSGFGAWRAREDPVKQLYSNKGQPQRWLSVSVML